MRFLYFFVSSLCLIGLVLLIRKVFRKKLAPEVIYALWLIPMIRLLLPFAGWELPVFGIAADILNAPYEIVSEMLEKNDLNEISVTDSEVQNEKIQWQEQIENENTGTKIYEAVNPTAQIAGTELPISESEKKLALVSPIQGKQLIPVCVWLAGSVIVGGYTLYRNRQLKRCIRQMEQRDMAKGIIVCVGNQVSVPCLAGILKPQIVVPEEIYQDQKLYECVLRHELAHFAQKDNLWTAVRILLCVIYWWNPLVWYASICAEEDAEIACDARALKGQTTEEKRNYGYALLQMLEHAQSRGQHLCAATSMSGDKKSMKRRIQEISAGTSTKRMVLLPALMLLVAVLVLGCGIPSSKSWIKTGDWDSNETEDAIVSESEFSYFLQDNIKSLLLYYEIYEYGNLMERRILMFGETDNPALSDNTLEFSREISKFSEDSKLYMLNNKSVTTCLPCPLSDYPGNGSSSFGVLNSDKKIEIVPEESLILTADYRTEGEKIQTFNCQVLSGYTEEELRETLKDNYAVGFLRIVFSEMSENELYQKYEQLEYPLSGETEDIMLSDSETFAASWAEAFCNRDINTILELSTDEAIARMQEYGILDEECTYFGWSSPWPMFGETLYEIVECDENGAYIRYYASDSTPHLTVWDSNIEFEKIDGEIKLTSLTYHFYEGIHTWEEFELAYPNRNVNGTPMDYYTNGLGEALNKNALLSSSMEYQALFDPITAAAKLLNISTNEELVCFVEKDTDAETMVQIIFLNDNGTEDLVGISMWQPDGEDGIWIPK